MAKANAQTEDELTAVRRFLRAAEEREEIAVASLAEAQVKLAERTEQCWSLARMCEAGLSSVLTMQETLDSACARIMNKLRKAEDDG